MSGRNLISRCDGTPLGDGVFEYCLKEACCAPLEQGAAAFGGLGLLFTASKDVSPACLQAELTAYTGGLHASPVGACSHVAFISCL